MAARPAQKREPLPLHCEVGLGKEAYNVFGLRIEMDKQFLDVFDKMAKKAGNGAIAQLGERVNGIHEVGGSIPPGSTKFSPYNLIT